MTDLNKLLKKIQDRKQKKEEKLRIKKEKELEKKAEKENLKKEKLKVQEKIRKEKLKEKENELLRRKKEKEKEKLAKEKKKLKEKQQKIQKKKKIQEKIKEEKRLKILNEKKIRKEQKSYYKIIVCSRNKINSTLKSTYFENKAYEYFNEEKEKANNVKFPMKYRNTFGKIVEAKNELLLVQKINDENQSTFLKNKYGKYTENIIVDKTNYIIIDKCEYPIEETFFVYGYHPYYERKNIDFIYDEFIKNNNYEFVSIVCFRNKLVIEYDYDMNIVICKNVDDTIRLYNVLKEFCEHDKIKKVTFKGQIPYSSSLDRDMIKKIKEKTGWNDIKIRRTSTRP